MTAASRNFHTVDEIDAAARARIIDLCHEWKLEGHYDAHCREFIALNPLRHDRSLGSFRVICEGGLVGLVKDFASGERWSPIQFTAALWFGKDEGQAVRWLKRWLGMEGGDPDAIAKTRAAVAARKDEGQVSDLDKKKRGAAHSLYAFGSQDLYDKATGELLNTPVYRYLLGRGIDLARFPGKVKALHYHMDLHHGPSCWCGGDYQKKRGPNGEGHVHYPGMIAAIHGPAGQDDFRGAHRTFLQVRPDGSVTKAPVGKDAKLCLGRYAGGMIRLWRGINVNPETGGATMKPKLGELAKRLEKGRGEKAELHLCEGIEDGLSIAQRFPELRVAAGVSLSNMGGLQYPPAVGSVVLWRDNDGAGSEADKGFAKVIANAQRQGLKVKVVTPPEGFKDVNDVLRHELKEGAA
jgi:hypothetical protein